MESHYEVVVIGGGQAGLAMGYHLARQGRRFIILDAGPAVGHAWRTRWSSLRLFTPARYSALPGLSFPADPEHHPGRDEVADYLESYAAAFSLPIRLETRVTALRPLPGGSGFGVETPTELLRADQVVVATGPFQSPQVPRIAAGLAPEIVQLHSSAYRGPAELPPGEVLVVGGGNSGVQIAAELATTRRVTLALGDRLACLPELLHGRSLFWWLETSGLLGVTADSWLGRRASQRDVLIGQSPEAVARELGVRLVGRVRQAAGDRVDTRDGEAVRVGAVVWATGYRSDYRWVHAPVLDGRGSPLHARGVTTQSGLYFLGLPWLHTRGSALIGWVGRDAEHLASHIRKNAPNRPGPGRTGSASTARDPDTPAPQAR